MLYPFRQAAIGLPFSSAWRQLPGVTACLWVACVCSCHPGVVSSAAPWCPVHAADATAAVMLQGKDPTQQKEIDDAMIALDGTENKGKLGANAILAVSMAVAKVSRQQPNACTMWRHSERLCRMTSYSG